MGDHKNKKPMTALDYINKLPKLQGKPLPIQNTYSALAEFPPLSYTKAVTSETGQSSAGQPLSKPTEKPTQKSTYYLKPNKQHLCTTQFDKPQTLKQLHTYTERLFYQDALYPTDNVTKNRLFYEYILVDSKSAEITHYPNPKNPNTISYSTCKILRIATTRDLGFLHHHTQKYFSQPGFHIPGYTYTDYVNAFFRAFYYQPYDHSWWISFDRNCPKAIPGWFFEWWHWFGPVDQIYPEQVIKSSYPYYLKHIPQTSVPALSKMHFHIDMGIPWICSWHFNLFILYQDLPYSLVREYRVKWWDKYNLDRCSLAAIEKYFQIHREATYAVKSISRSIPLLTPSQLTQPPAPASSPRPASPAISTSSSSSRKTSRKEKLQKFLDLLSDSDDDHPMQIDENDPFGGPLAQDPNA